MHKDCFCVPLIGSEPFLCQFWYVAELSLNGLADALRGADFSTLEAAHEQVRERDREAERSIEQERDISRERDDGYSL